MLRVVVCLILILLLSSVVWALPDSEVQKLVQSDPDFARVEKILLDTWKELPSDLKRKIRKSQLEWIETERDKEANELMGIGLTYAQAYTLSTAMRNNIVAETLPPKLKARAVFIDLEALARQYAPAAQEEMKRRRQSVETEIGHQKSAPDEQAQVQALQADTENKVREAQQRQLLADQQAEQKRLAEVLLADKEKAEQALAASFFLAPLEVVTEETAYQLTVAFARDPVKTREKLTDVSEEKLSMLLQQVQALSRRTEAEDTSLKFDREQAASSPAFVDETPLEALLADLAGSRIYGLALVGRLGAQVVGDGQESVALHLFHPLEGTETLAVSLEPSVVDHRAGGETVRIFCRGNYERDCSVMKIEEYQADVSDLNKGGHRAWDYRAEPVWLVSAGAIILGLVALLWVRRRAKAGPRPTKTPDEPPRDSTKEADA